MPEILAQIPRPHEKATEQVVARYEHLIANGALLTPEGWQRAAKLFHQSNPYPRKGMIFLTSTGGTVGETWVKNHRAQVETKWNDYYGRIDSALRYFPPERPHVAMASYIFHLVFTNRHREISDGGITKEIPGPWEWQIEGPQQERWATIDKALLYVTKTRDQTSDSIIKRNANKTIAIVRRMKSAWCSNCAC